MDFESSVKAGYARVIVKNKNRAKSLVKSAEQAIETAKLIPLKENSLKSVLRELYEGLRQYCEAIGFVKGYKFESHEVVTYFLRDVLKEDKISGKFDRYRKLRHGVNYYGNEIDVSTVKDVLAEVPEMLNILKKHLEKDEGVRDGPG
ncbi:MAG: hypothetical protein KJ718_01790 [Nanoarchaeota archaeon]|nr:hypothetical protein [Nanoarchaeota archaeon]MBU1987924.1 hypothetical protein [Nanoarchaeota archaeon]